MCEHFFLAVYWRHAELRVVNFTACAHNKCTYILCVSSAYKCSFAVIRCHYLLKLRFGIKKFSVMLSSSRKSNVIYWRVCSEKCLVGLVCMIGSCAHISVIYRAVPFILQAYSKACSSPGTRTARWIWANVEMRVALRVSYSVWIWAIMVG
jgi:hypothetical protein